MTNQEKIEALARLDGKTYHKPTEQEIASGSYYQYEPAYLTSHDALQPILDKMTNDQWWRFGDAACEVFGDFPTFAQGYLTLTPTQKADCILKACGLWKD